MENNNYQMEMYKGYTIKIEVDTDPINPITDWDMLGTFACFHRRYDLSNTKQFNDADDLQDFLKENENISLPLYLYEHSGITISCSNSSYPFNDRWDSGQVGIIFVTYENIKKEYNCKRITKKIRETVLRVLEGEVKTFDQYLTGEVFGFTIEDQNGDQIDSCWGYYGYDSIKDIIEECKGTIDYDIERKEKEAIELKAKQIYFYSCMSAMMQRKI